AQRRRDATAAGADDDGHGQRALAGGDVVDGDLGAGRIRGDGDVGNAGVEALDLALHLRDAGGSDGRPTLPEILAEVAQRARVVLELGADLSDVVEDLEIRVELVSAAELDDGGGHIAVLEELLAALPARLRFLAIGGASAGAGAAAVARGGRGAGEE